MERLKHLISRALSFLMFGSIAWVIIESILIEILNFGLFDDFQLNFDSLILSLMLIPLVLLYNFVFFKEITIWIGETKSDNKNR